MVPDSLSEIFILLLLFRTPERRAPLPVLRDPFLGTPYCLQI